MWQKLWCSRLGDQKWVLDSWGEMGNKGSRGRNGLSKETVDFLVKNTKFSREMIKVAVSYKTETLLACTRCSKVVSYLHFHLFASSVVHRFHFIHICLFLPADEWYAGSTVQCSPVCLCRSGTLVLWVLSWVWDTLGHCPHPPPLPPNPRSVKMSNVGDRNYIQGEFHHPPCLD